MGLGEFIQVSAFLSPEVFESFPLSDAKVLLPPPVTLHGGVSGTLAKTANCRSSCHAFLKNALKPLTSFQWKREPHLPSPCTPSPFSPVPPRCVPLCTSQFLSLFHSVMHFSGSAFCSHTTLGLYVVSQPSKLWREEDGGRCLCWEGEGLREETLNSEGCFRVMGSQGITDYSWMF